MCCWSAEDVMVRVQWARAPSILDGGKANNAAPDSAC
jgi:hypothetical protein